MIRRCPKCRTERPLEEVLCQGLFEGSTCLWDLTSVSPSQPGAEPSQPVRLSCPAGHPVSEGDLICPTCGTALGSVGAEVSETVIDGWHVLDRFEPASASHRAFRVERDGQQAVLTLYEEGSEPDPEVYEALRVMDRDHRPDILATGRYEDRPYEVSEEIQGGDLRRLEVEPADLSAIRRIVDEIGRALEHFGRVGLRHRDLRPANVLVRTKEPLDLVITGFGSARLSEYDLDTVAPLDTTRYTAPEAIAGGVAPASDWWSLGMVILEKATAGRCFEGVNDQAFLIHVVTEGVALPEDLDPQLRLLLRGLLARDRTVRWQGPQVQAWLRGDPVTAPPEEGVSEEEGRVSIRLGGLEHRRIANYALAAAEKGNWEEARDQLLRGALATWLEQTGMAQTGLARVRHIARTEGLDDDTRLSLVLKVLNPNLPLIRAGEIVSPPWLLEHPIEGYRLISGAAPEILRQMDAEAWLLALNRREVAVRKRAARHEIELNEETLKVALLSTSRARLAAQWETQRRLLPDTDHAGLSALLDRRQTAEEDLIVLLSASAHQFRSLEDVVQQAVEQARLAGVSSFEPEGARDLLQKSRLEIYRELDDRLEGFGRCGIPRIDEWADQFRIERRLSLGRAAVLHSVPAEQWAKPPRQEYYEQILDFFRKKVTVSITRGPLARMTIGRTTARVDLMELETPQHSAASLLESLVDRTDLLQPLDPYALRQEGSESGGAGLESRLRRLQHHAALYKRDTGIDGLYLGFPFLLVRPPSSTIKPRIAPVLLWPVRIQAEIGTRHFSLGFDRDREEVRLNPALEVFLGPDAGGRWEDVRRELLTRPLKPRDVIDAFSGLSASVGAELGPLPAPEAEVDPGAGRLCCSAVLFHAAFVGQASIEDLRQLRSMPVQGSALEGALRLATPSSAEAEPTSDGEALHLTVASDPSQEEVVHRARRMPGLLVEGPPGTGKSQTIVNVIGDAIGRGKSILVVCQKQAALEVVYKRLEKEGIENRILLITDVHKDRQRVIRTVREQLEALHDGGRADTSWRRKRKAALERVQRLEEELQAYHGWLHRAEESTGLSYRDVVGGLLRLEESPVPQMELPDLRRLLGEYTPERVEAVAAECGSLASSWLPAKYEGSALAVLKHFGWDPATLRALTKDFEAFASAEERRSRCVRPDGDSFALQEFQRVRRWLRERRGALGALSSEERGRIAEWLGVLWSEPASSPARALEEQLAHLIESARALGEHPPPPQAVWFIFVSFSDRKLARWIRRAERATRPRSWRSRLNPMRAFRRRRLARLLHPGISELTKAERDAQFESFLASARAEAAVRPFRADLAEVGRKLARSELPFETRSAAQLVSGAEELCRDLAAARRQVEPLVGSQQPDAAREALRQATEEAYSGLFDRYDAAIAEHDATVSSVECLGALERWFDQAWIATCRARIEAADPALDHVRPVAEAFPTAGAFQEFTARSASLSRDAWSVFGLLDRSREVLQAVAESDLDAALRKAIQREARLAWKERLEREHPSLLWEARDVETRVRDLQAADDELRRLNRTALAQDIETHNLTFAKWEDITRLTGPRTKRLREFFDLGVDLGLMKLRPVWLMNPDVASRLLPLKNALFDTVIYDEASQIPVELALPTLYRGQTMIVSGDEKQLPPTSFFASKVEADEAEILEGDDSGSDELSEEEIEAAEEAWNRREIKDCPDLLHLARAVLPRKALEIHYRSVYRELIDFSNRSFYAGDLHVPVRHPDNEIRRVRPIELEDVRGVYQQQTNREEARRVVEILARYWEADPASRPSIGTVTFNRKQADLIEELLEERAQTDAAFRTALTQESDRQEDGEDMGFFVKNVENVQGDERDVILFSTTFGRNPEGRFRRFFGVLGQKGGERRLNVAVTRARKKVVLVTSMPIGDVSDLLSGRQTPSKPRDYLQAYLEYARRLCLGEILEARELLMRMGEHRQRKDSEGTQEGDGFQESVERFLRDQGWNPVRADDGTAFGLDFAIENPQTGLYAIGIECDAPRSRVLQSARAREIWRQSVMSGSVPLICRVSSRAWYHNKPAEGERLCRAIRSALTERGAQ